MKKIFSTCVPLPMENIDTDQIIPARFLKAVTREGFDQHLFRDWRFDSNNKPRKDFVLNDKTFKGKILVTRRNFGIGSSREHAAWALKDYGFDAVVSSFFADIFKTNALINQLLPVTVSPDFLKKLFAEIKKNPQTIVNIDIPNQIIEIKNANIKEKFPLDPYRKMCLIKGYDDINYLLNQKFDIIKFEKQRKNDFSI
ncbi:3-isopropylmalate dehydratase small subunit [Candidatus Microgenomates bacterium]|nr:3-isopropylmalate dehydratase small subunit [Candidatus Microgenomates bacterium]